MTQASDYAWLPLHQHHVALTLGHVDALTQHVADLLFGYLEPPGPLGLENQPDGNLAHVTVTSIPPLPPSIPRYSADALTQARAAVEHTLYAEVEARLGRPLSPQEQRAIEVPAATTYDDFEAWLNTRARKALPPLQAGSELVQRLRTLQPYQRVNDVENHPLRLLAQHTNACKHRTPVVAATLLGAVHTEPLGHPDVIVASGPDRPLVVGDRLATGPLYLQVPLAIWPKVSIQRPHTGRWHVLMKELGSIQAWVRKVAIPILVTGRTDVCHLPPQVDTSKGVADVPSALVAAGLVPANERYLTVIQAHTGRGDLVETLMLHPHPQDSKLVQAWVAHLQDHEVVARLDQLGHAAKRGPMQTLRAVDALLAEAREWAADAGSARDGGIGGGCGPLPGE